MFKLVAELDGEVEKEFGTHADLEACAEEQAMQEFEHDAWDDEWIPVAVDTHSGDRFMLEMGAWWPEKGGPAAWREDG